MARPYACAVCVEEKEREKQRMAGMDMGKLEWVLWTVKMIDLTFQDKLDSFHSVRTATVAIPLFSVVARIQCLWCGVLYLHLILIDKFPVTFRSTNVNHRHRQTFCTHQSQHYLSIHRRPLTLSLCCCLSERQQFNGLQLRFKFVECF